MDPRVQADVALLTALVAVMVVAIVGEARLRSRRPAATRSQAKLWWVATGLALVILGALAGDVLEG